MSGDRQHALIAGADSRFPTSSSRPYVYPAAPGSVAAVTCKPLDVIVSPLFPQFGHELPGSAV